MPGSGVRSSWPASEPPRRLHRGLQAGEHVVERARERAHLVRAVVGRQRRAEVVGAANAGRSGSQTRERAQRQACEQPRRQPGERQGEDADRGHEPARGGDALAHRRERLRNLDALVAQRLGQRAPGLAVDRDRRQPVAGGQRRGLARHVALAVDDRAAVGDLGERAAAHEQALRSVTAEPVVVVVGRPAADLLYPLGELGVDGGAPSRPQHPADAADRVQDAGFAACLELAA
jgi:hypothetical protein